MSTEVTLVCDRCGMILGAARTAKEARLTCRHFRHASKDYCDYCWKEGRNEGLAYGQGADVS